MIKVTNFIIAAIFIGLFAVIISGFMGAVYNQTGATGANNLTFINKTENLTTIVYDTEASSRNLSSGGALDLIGAYLVSATDAVRASTKSVEIVGAITSDSVAELPLADGVSSLLINSIATILLVLISIGVIISILAKREI